MAMTPDQVITKAYVHAQRKAVPPASGTPKYLALLAIVDSMQKLWANEPDVEWDSLYENRTLAVAASATDTFALDADIDHLSKREDDPVLVGTKPYKIVRPNQLYKYRLSDVCAIRGGSLVFSHVLDASQAGDDIIVPAILVVPDIDTGAATDQVVVPDPMWLAYASAAEFDRNDIVKMNQYNNILALADQCMQRMKNENSGSLDEVDTSWRPDGGEYL